MTPPDLHSEETLDVASPPKPVARPLLSQTRRSTASPDAWMVTFTDLVALMLTFFVLLYSMSRLDLVKWQNLTGSLASSLDSVSESQVVEPKAQLDIAPVQFVPGTDLDYLTNVLSERLRSDPQLNDILLRNRGDRLVLSLPDSLLLDERSWQLGAQAERTMFALGGVFRTISNSVEVIAYPLERAEGERLPGQDNETGEAVWTQALSRAITLARWLTNAGYKGSVRPKGVTWQPVSDGQEELDQDRGDDALTAAVYRFELVVLDSEGER